MSYIQEQIRKTASILERWDDSHVRLAELTQSHSTLRVVLTKKGKEGVLVIACLEPEHIHAPLSWAGSQVRIACISENGKPECARLEDTKHGCAILMGSFEIRENVRV